MWSNLVLEGAKDLLTPTSLYPIRDKNAREQRESYLEGKSWIWYTKGAQRTCAAGLRIHGLMSPDIYKTIGTEMCPDFTERGGIIYEESDYHQS